MSETSAGGCERCRRHSLLLGELSPLLDYQRSDPDRLLGLLELEAGELVEAIGGRRREALRALLQEPDPLQAPGHGFRFHCRHEPGSPAALAGPGSLGFLWSGADPGRLRALLQGPRVAITGAPRPTPYGLAVAHAMGRGLAAAGVTVLAGLPSALGRAAHEGALASGKGSLALAGDGLLRIRPALAQALARRLRQAGAVASAPWPGASGRRWGALGAEAWIAGLAEVLVLIEAPDASREPLAVRAARRASRPLAVVPGAVTNAGSAVGHRLIREHQATLVREASDVLELLGVPNPRAGRPVQSRLPERLRSVLERAGAEPIDPADAELARALPAGEILACLGELEALGLVRRVAGGCWQATHPIPAVWPKR